MKSQAFKSSSKSQIILYNLKTMSIALKRRTLWLSTKYTIEFMGFRVKMHNPDFNVTEFGNIKNESGSNGFILSNKVCELFLQNHVDAHYCGEDEFSDVGISRDITVDLKHVIIG